MLIQFFFILALPFIVLAADVENVPQVQDYVSLAEQLRQNLSQSGLRIAGVKVASIQKLEGNGIYLGHFEVQRDGIQRPLKVALPVTLGGIALPVPQLMTELNSRAHLVLLTELGPRGEAFGSKQLHALSAQLSLAQVKLEGILAKLGQNPGGYNKQTYDSLMQRFRQLVANTPSFFAEVKVEGESVIKSIAPSLYFPAEFKSNSIETYYSRTYSNSVMHGNRANYIELMFEQYKGMPAPYDRVQLEEQLRVARAQQAIFHQFASTLLELLLLNDSMTIADKSAEERLRVITQIEDIKRAKNVMIPALLKVIDSRGPWNQAETMALREALNDLCYRINKLRFIGLNVTDLPTHQWETGLMLNNLEELMRDGLTSGKTEAEKFQKDMVGEATALQIKIGSTIVGMDAELNALKQARDLEVNPKDAERLKSLELQLSVLKTQLAEAIALRESATKLRKTR